MGNAAQFMGLVSMGISQFFNVHNQVLNSKRQQQMLQQQATIAQRQQCPPPAKLEVVITQSGQRQLVCVQEEVK